MGGISYGGGIGSLHGYGALAGGLGNAGLGNGGAVNAGGKTNAS